MAAHVLLLYGMSENHIALVAEREEDQEKYGQKRLKFDIDRHKDRLIKGE